MRFGAHFPWVQALAARGARDGPFGPCGRQRPRSSRGFCEMRIHDEWALESEFGLSYESWIDRWEEKA